MKSQQLAAPSRQHAAPAPQRPLLVRLLGLYPAAWRECYGEELGDLLASEPVTPLSLAAVLWGVLDAQLHPHLPTPGVLSSRGERLRLATLAVFGASMGALVAALFFIEAVADLAGASLMQTQPGLQGPWLVLVASAVVAGLALLAGGMPIVLAVIRDAHRRRSPALRALAIPPLALLLLVGCDVFEKGRHLAHLQWPGGVELTLDVLWHTLFVLAAVVSTGAVCLAVLHSRIPDQLFRWALAPAAVGTLGLVVMLAAAVRWLVGARTLALAAFDQSAITLGFVLLIVLMVVTTVCAAWGVVRGLAPRRRST